SVVEEEMEPDNRETVSGSMEEGTISAGVLGQIPLTAKPATDIACSYIPEEHAYVHIKPEPVQYPGGGKKRAVKRLAESPVQTAMADEIPEMKPVLSSDFMPESSSANVRIVESKEASSTTLQYQNLRELSSKGKSSYMAYNGGVYSMNYRAKKAQKVLDRAEEIVTLSKKTASKKYKTVGDVKKEFVPVPMEITLDNVSESVKKSIKKDLMPQSLRGCVDTYGELFISKLLCCYKWELISKNDTPSNLKVVPFEMSSEVVSVYDKLKSEGKLSTGTGFSDFYRNVFNPIYAKSSRDRKKQYKQWLDNCLMELKRELKQKTSWHKVIEHKVVEVGKEIDVKKAEVIESSQQKSDWNIEPKPGCSWMDLS
ncbi:MAG: hypothetical protein ACPG5T_03230, partial [Endozoicomonas sp.]